MSDPEQQPGRIRRRTALAGVSTLLLTGQAPVTAVDLQLVLSVDVSRSIDEDEARLQREGYRTAMTDPQVVAAITNGSLGAIAIAYVEWAAYTVQTLVLPWTRVAGAGDPASWAARLAASPRQSMSWTSLSGALRFSRSVLQSCPWEGTRRVIDVSGDGMNNNGPPAEEERDRLVAEGTTINGLPIVNDRPNFGMRPGEDLESYYRGAVIGGPGAFLIVAKDFASFGEAIRRKLIQEIAANPMVNAG
jgi:hypothetical protein